MSYSQPVLKKIIAVVCTVFLAIFADAQTTGTAAATTATTTPPTNQLVILMGVIAALLAFVIWGMGQVLVITGKQAIDKQKQEGKILSIVLLLGFSLCSLTSNAQQTAVADVTVAPANYGGMDATAFWTLATVLFTELVIIAFMLFSIRRIMAELLPQKEKVKSVVLKEWWAKLDRKLFTKAVAVEKEADILLDHDYDGIKELDNALPPWWKYGFMITIGIATIYLLNFHVFGYGKNPTEEYQQELATAAIQKEIYDAKNADKIDEANLKMPTAAGLAAGKEIFTSVCWACHGKLGEGGAGPNLTDDNWIHKGSLADVYQSIKHGYPDKGMQAWEKNYSPKEMNDLAGYIKTLRGTNPPNAKAPQGDLYVEVALTDSSAIQKK